MIVKYILDKMARLTDMSLATQNLRLAWFYFILLLLWRRIRLFYPLEIQD